MYDVSRVALVIEINQGVVGITLSAWKSFEFSRICNLLFSEGFSRIWLISCPALFQIATLQALEGTSNRLFVLSSLINRLLELRLVPFEVLVIEGWDLIWDSDLFLAHALLSLCWG